MLITADLKDLILKDLISLNSIDVAQNINDAQKDFGIDRAVLSAILDHFEELGFIEQRKLLGGLIHISIKVRAYDFYSHGGFIAQEELLAKDIEKLLLEIESLKPSMPDRVNTITAIAGNITTALGLFIK